MDNNIFNNIEKEAKVNKEDIFKLASSVQNANLRDETCTSSIDSSSGSYGRT